MYADDMAVTKKAKRPGPVPQGLVQVQFRFPRSLIEALDKYTEELNEGREWPILTRTDVVRGLIKWAAKHKPDWEHDE